MMWSLAAAGKFAAVLAVAGAASLTTAGLFEGRVIEPETRVVQLDTGKTINVATLEVTYASWAACQAAGACSYLPRANDELKGTDYPVTGVSYLDAMEYIDWINVATGRAATGQAYRLPTADEWKAAARELPQAPYKKLFDDPRLAWAADYGAMPAVSPKLKASGGFGTFQNGISDLAGNVWEWTSSCAVAAAAARCPAYLVEGLHEAKLSIFIREPAVGGCAAGVPPAHVGLRLVRD
jgi:formylglycine-generating enzyme required for sulfatase activity